MEVIEAMLELRPTCENCNTALPPDSLDARIEHALALFECGRFDESKRELTQLSRDEPDEPSAWHYLGLLAARSVLGEAAVRAEDLLMAALRMRPDRIILGELRGTEALTFLRAVNTGHPGSMTTIHADSPVRAIEQLALLVLQAGSRLGRDDVRHYVRESIDVFAQLEREAGRRKVAQVLVRS